MALAGHYIAALLCAGGDPDSSETEDLYGMAYTHFVEEVDGVDNGIHARDGEPRSASLSLCVYQYICLIVYFVLSRIGQ